MKGMKGLDIRAVVHCTKGDFHGIQDSMSEKIKSITTDSRQVEPGALFIAIKGERVDGHNYIKQAFEKGAAAVVGERLIDCSGPYILVESSFRAVGAIAEYYRRQLSIPMVGITGSVGKTSTKEMVASVLSRKYYLLKTAGNFNNELGVPFTLFRIRQEHQLAVIEMGISDFGEMHRLTNMVKPNTVILTNIGSCHLENLKSRDGVLQAKTEIFDSLCEDGKVFCNGDDDKLITIKEVNGKAPVFFGLEKHNQVRAEHIENLGLEGSRCTIITPMGNIQATIPIPGNHMIYNALAAAAVGLHYGLSLEQIKEGIEGAQTVSGRFHLIHANNYTVIDDCYNANPVSMKASLDVLETALGRKVAILGDMFELGEKEEELHYQVGQYAAGKNINLFICIGKLSKKLAEGIKAENGMIDNKKILIYETKEQWMEEKNATLQKGDTILVKASHGMEFSKVVEVLTEQ